MCRVNASDYDDLKTDIRSVRSTISTLEANIQGAYGRITQLNSEKSTLESRLRSLRSTLSQEDTAKENSEKRINKARELGLNITSLQRQADTTSADVREAVRELQGLKSSLNEMELSINKKTQQLTAESSGLRQRQTAGTARARHSTRQLDAIKRATVALTDAQMKLPRLLPTSSVKLLTDSMSKDKLTPSVVFEEMPRYVGNGYKTSSIGLISCILALLLPTLLYITAFLLNCG